MLLIEGLGRAEGSNGQNKEGTGNMSISSCCFCRMFIYFISFTFRYMYRLCLHVQEVNFDHITKYPQDAIVIHSSAISSMNKSKDLCNCDV